MERERYPSYRTEMLLAVDAIEGSRKVEARLGPATPIEIESPKCALPMSVPSQLLTESPFARGIKGSIVVLGNCFSSNFEAVLLFESW